MKKPPKSYHAADAPSPMGQYPHARRAGKLLFLSGVGPRDPATNKVPGVTRNQQGDITGYDIIAQCHAVFRNVRIILEASGARWDQLVDVTVFLTDLKKDFADYNKIYAQYFQDDQPCRTTLGITSLPSPIAIELKCIASLEE